MDSRLKTYSMGFQLARSIQRLGTRTIHLQLFPHPHQSVQIATNVSDRIGQMGRVTTTILLTSVATPRMRLGIMPRMGMLMLVVAVLKAILGGSMYRVRQMRR